MVKILIWNSFELKERNGGPPTYLFNLKTGLDSHINSNELEIEFLSDVLDLKFESFSDNKLVANLKRLFPNIFIKNLRVLNYLIVLWKSKLDFDINKLNEYDAIHFHLSIDIYKNRNILKHYKGKILLTSHSPEPSWIETIEDIYGLALNKTFTFFKNILESMDLYGFKKAHLLVFPCIEAVEPYLNWKRYRLEVHDNANYEYLPSGIPQVKFKNQRELIRKELKVPENAIVFSFIGRHSVVKGYDLLLKLGESVLEKYPNVFFLIAGKEVPLAGLSHPNWIEIGWTDDPHSFVNASDVFILPNRQTFFDLVLLEVLSVNKPIILSDSGGNKHFKIYTKSGFYYFDNNSLSSLKKVVYEFIENSFLLKDLGKINKEIFDSHYSLRPFVMRYSELYISLVSK